MASMSKAPLPDQPVEPAFSINMGEGLDIGASPPHAYVEGLRHPVLWLCA